MNHTSVPMTPEVMEHSGMVSPIKTHAHAHAHTQSMRKSQSQKSTKQLMRVTSDTRFGVKKGGNVFLAEEERFQWQKPINDFDAFYDLPSTMAKHKTAVFGSSTRSDWENTWKNKRDSVNPNAGPGQNGNPDDRVKSDYPSVPTTKFGYSQRMNINANKLAPGPKYELEGVFKHGRDRKIKISFNKDQRKPLADNESTDAYYVPKLPKGKAITIGGRRKEKKLGLGEFQSPGPIYDMYKYGFGCELKCGRGSPSFSFGRSRASRFKERMDQMF